MAGRFSVEAVFSATDNMTQPIRRMQRRIGRFTRSLEHGLRAAQRATGKLVGGLTSLAKKTLALVAGSVTAVALALNRVADSADALAKQSRRLQFPVEDLQEWKFVAEQSGVSTELLDKSLGAFSKRLGEAKAGTGPLVAGLKKLNPQLLAQLKRTDSISEAFEIYVDAMRDAEKATEKAALANAAFSRAGLDLVNISANSADAIRAMRLEQRENGNITMAQAEAAERYNDAVNSLKRSVIGLIQSALLPLADDLANLALKWREIIIANKEVIQQKVKKFFEAMGAAIGRVINALQELEKTHGIIETVGEFARASADALIFLGKHGKTILTVTGWVIGLNLALKAFTLVMAIVNAVMMANPIGLLVAGIGLLIAAVASAIIWWDEFTDALSVGWSPVSDAWDAAFGFIEKFWANVTSVFDSAVDMIATAIGAITDMINDVIDAVVGATAVVTDFIGLTDSGGGVKLVEMSAAEKAESARQWARVGGEAGLDRLIAARDKGLIRDEDIFAVQEGRKSLREVEAMINSPQERVARTIEERRSTAEVTIRDETGRAEVTGGTLSSSVQLQHSGAF